jgi:hypothetical protein
MWTETGIRAILRPMDTKTHPFERAGLGTAPFRCVSVRTNWFTVPGCPEASKPGGSCQYCGTGILYEFVIKSADGREFVVGSDCVRRTGAQVEGFREQRLQLARTQRATKRQERYTERRARWEAEAAAKLPEFDASYPGLRDKLAAESTLEGGDPFLKDLHRKLIGWGGLSEKQVAAAESVFARRAREAAAQPLPDFTGRAQITGTVLSLKEVEYPAWPPRTVLKMLVQHADGWKVFGTVPAGVGSRRAQGQDRDVLRAHRALEGRQQVRFLLAADQGRCRRAAGGRVNGNQKRPAPDTDTDVFLRASELYQQHRRTLGVWASIDETAKQIQTSSATVARILGFKAPGEQS